MTTHDNTALPPLRPEEMPERSLSFWKLTGPGAVMAGVAIGSGELILWPWITAKFGADMAWAAAIGVFLQLWINIEIGRWAVATGESAFTGMARISRAAIYFFLVLLCIQALLPGWARATGSAFKCLVFGSVGPGADWVWTLLVFGLIAILIFGPKRFYTSIEISISLLVLIIVVGMIFVAIRVGTWADAAAMGRGVLNVGKFRFDDEFSPLRLFGAVVFAGAGGFSNLYYAYYLRDKGVGMGSRIPPLANPLRGIDEPSVDTGFKYNDTPENGARFRDWFNFVKLDTTIYFWALTTLTLFLFMFGALVVLHPLGVVPSEATLVWDLATILESSMGVGGRYLFLIIGMAALFSTQLTILDGSVRMWVDISHTNFGWTRRYTSGKLYIALALGLMALGVLSTWFFETFDVTALDFLFLNAVSNGFAMAVYVPLILYINMRILPVSARPKPFNVAMVCIGASVYISFAIYTVADKLIGWLS